MSTQTTLLPDDIHGRFTAFHHDNPDVYMHLVSMARTWKQQGHEKCSINMLFEVMRWQMGVTTTGDQFKLNNNFRSRYARLIEQNEPDLAGLFEVRQLKTDWTPGGDA